MLSNMTSQSCVLGMPCLPINYRIHKIVFFQFSITAPGYVIDDYGDNTLCMTMNGFSKTKKTPF